MIALAIALQASVPSISADDRRAFEAYRQCVLISSMYAKPDEDLASAVRTAEASCQGNHPIGLIDLRGDAATVRHTSDRLTLNPDIERALNDELSVEVADQITKMRSGAKNRARN